jgi:molybdopterin-guanine dinucleotide biosynthesis protein A
MGAPKALMPFRGAFLIDAVIARAAPQVRSLGIDVARGDEAAFRARYGNAVVPDLFAQKLGPLCGIVTGLGWCESGWLATFPCDAPFLPHDLVAQLAAHADTRPVAARHGGRVHGVCGLWPRTALTCLKNGVESGRLRSLHDALAEFDGVACDITAPDDAFFNVNTREELARAERHPSTSSG